MRVPRLRFTVPPDDGRCGGRGGCVLAVSPFPQRYANYHRKALEHARLVGVSRENAKVQLSGVAGASRSSGIVGGQCRGVGAASRVACRSRAEIQ